MPGASDERLSILLTVHHELAGGTGAAGSTLTLAAELEDRGHRVDVLGFDGLARRRGAMLDAARFPHRVRRELTRRLALGDLDVVDASTGDLAYLSTGQVRHARVAVFTRSHGLEQLASERRRRGARAGELELRLRYSLYHGGLRLREVDRSMRVADAVLVLNDAETHYAQQRLGVDPGRLWRTSPVADDRVPRLPRTPTRDLLVLGPCSWRKGGDVAVRVLEAVLRADPMATASWHGLDDAAGVVAELATGLRSRAQLAGPYARTELASLLATHKVLLFASRSEGLPVTLLEALRAGVAVVGADVPGVHDLLHGGVGVLVPDGHVEGMAGAVRTLIADDEARGECEARSERVAALHAPSAVVERLLHAYRTVLERKRRAD